MFAVTLGKMPTWNTMRADIDTKRNELRDGIKQSIAPQKRPASAASIEQLPMSPRSSARPRASTSSTRPWPIVRQLVDKSKMTPMAIFPYPKDPVQERRRPRGSPMPNGSAGSGSAGGRPRKPSPRRRVTSLRPARPFDVGQLFLCPRLDHRWSSRFLPCAVEMRIRHSEGRAALKHRRQKGHLPASPLSLLWIHAVMSWAVAGPWLLEP
jgi:hypothetical protein